MSQPQAFRTWVMLGITLSALGATFLVVEWVRATGSPGAKWAISAVSVLLLIAAIVGARHRYPWLVEGQVIEHPAQVAVGVGLVAIVALCAVAFAALRA